MRKFDDHMVFSMDGSNVGFLTVLFERAWRCFIRTIDSDYLFGSSKFDKAFDFKTTSYSQGIRETVKSMK